jgi:hypothetical protein
MLHASAFSTSADIEAKEEELSFFLLLLFFSLRHFCFFAVGGD